MIGCFIQTSFGQIEKPFTKGNILTGGSIKVSFKQNKEYFSNINPTPDLTYVKDINNIEGGLSIGIFLIDRFAIGLKNEIMFSGYKMENYISSNIVADNKYIDFVVGPFIRYYTKPGIFIDCSTCIGLINDSRNKEILKSRNYTWNIGVGYCIFINNYISIEPILKYDNRIIKEIETTEYVKSNELILSVGLQIYFKKLSKNP